MPGEDIKKFADFGTALASYGGTMMKRKKVKKKKLKRLAKMAKQVEGLSIF